MSPEKPKYIPSAGHIANVVGNVMEASNAQPFPEPVHNAFQAGVVSVILELASRHEGKVSEILTEYDFMEFASEQPPIDNMRLNSHREVRKRKTEYPDYEREMIEAFITDLDEDYGYKGRMLFDRFKNTLVTSVQLIQRRRETIESARQFDYTARRVRPNEIKEGNSLSTRPVAGGGGVRVGRQTLKRPYRR